MKETKRKPNGNQTETEPKPNFCSGNQSIDNVIGEHNLLRERADMSEFVWVRRNGSIDGWDVVEEVDVLGMTSSFYASQHVITYRCFHH